jgi:hypothetical protein
MSPNNPLEKAAERYLRVEAGAAQWQEFDESQQQAYIRIAKMIAEAIDDMPPLDQPTRAIDAIRRTRSAFVIGGRGTGKTTVLDTFRRDSRPGSARDAEAARVRPELDKKSRDRQEAWTRDRQLLLQQIRGRVVWLETLDMEPLPPDANLLAAILVRLEDAARGFSGEAGRKPRGLMEPSSEYHSALLELQRLQTDVALAWEGNLRDRQGSLDPDAYAVEVMRVETSRLSLNSKFAETLRKLALHVFRSRDVEDVLFVLPVDDFDLNPPITLDLLRVLRLISIPRLFTIVLGDLNVASTVLSLKLSNDLGSIARRLQVTMLAVLPATVASLAGDVAANAIRKLLPPGQRVELWPMRLPEAMNFRPLGSIDADPYLHELFGRCPVYCGWQLPPVPGSQETPLEREVKWGRSSLRRLLLAPKLTDQVWKVATATASPPAPAPPAAAPASMRALSRKVAEEAIYSGTRFVQAPPRRIVDTWLELYKVDLSAGVVAASPNEGEEQEEKEIEREQEAFDPLLTFFAEACRAALRETAIFMPEERDDVDRAVSRTVAGSWTLRPLPLTLRTETTSPRPVELTPDARQAQEPGRRTKPKPGPARSAPALLTARIHVAESLGWQIQIYVGHSGTRPPGLEPDWEARRPRRLLSDNAVTALIVYHDLLAFSPRGATSFITPLLTPANLELDWASTEWKLSPPVTFPWPEPPCTTFFDYDCFRAVWNDVIRNQEIMQATAQLQTIERLAFAWISFGTAVVRRAPPLAVTSWHEPLPWVALIQQLEALTGYIASHQEGSRYSEWLRRLAELLMPEMGLPEPVTKPFSESQQLKEVWIKNRLALRERRLRRLRMLHEVDPEFAEHVRASVVIGELTPERSSVAGSVERQDSATSAHPPPEAAAAQTTEPA